MKQKVFVTGLSSSLLQQIVGYLPLDKFEILALTRKNHPEPQEGVTWLHGSLETIGLLEEDLAGISFIIHGAAVTHTPDIGEYFRINYEATKNLVDISNRIGGVKFIYISSRAAVPGSGGYGESKLKAEEYVRTNCKSWIVYKPSEIYGGMKNEGIESLIQDALSKTVQIYPGGESLMYPVSLEDTSKLIYEYSFEKGHWNQTLIVNGTEAYSYKSLIELVSKITGKSKILLPIPKFIMYFIQWVISNTGLKISIVPDQIDRFYAPKPIGHIDFPYESITAYIRKLTKGQ